MADQEHGSAVEELKRAQEAGLSEAALARLQIRAGIEAPGVDTPLTLSEQVSRLESEGVTVSPHMLITAGMEQAAHYKRPEARIITE